MAGDSDINQTDIQAHVQTYGSVIGLLKWGAVGVVAIAAAVILIIAR